MRTQFVRNGISFAGLVLALGLGTGCIVVIGPGCDWDCSPQSWVEETVELPIDAGDLTAMEVRTQNGEIEFTGLPAGSAGTVVVRKKAGGRSADEAKEAMSALEIISERSESGEHKLGWRWKGVKKSNWAADVSFSIQAQGELRFDAETHNGAVTAAGIRGDTTVVTHNGRVKVDSREGKLHAVTHNGAIAATYNGSSVTLETHNGEVKADLSQAGPVRGDIQTYNGAVEVSVGAATAADLVAETHNGRVTYDAPLTVGSVEKNRLEGKLGQGGQRLEVTTHNGSISIKAAG